MSIKCVCTDPFECPHPLCLDEMPPTKAESLQSSEARLEHKRWLGRESRRRRNDRHKALGLCVYCANPAISERVYCEVCREKRVQYSAKMRAARAEKKNKPV